ncbi:hypothetical protein Trydic_g1218 [Trypoxylus dichotomus]
MDGTLGHTVHPEATHTNRYLNVQIHQHLAQLQVVVKTLVPRSQRLADADHIRTESSEIQYILRTNGFTINTINRAFHTKTMQMDITTYVTKAYPPLHKGYNGQNSPSKQKNKCQKRIAETSGTTAVLAQHVLMTGHKIRKNNNDKHERTSSDKDYSRSHRDREASEQPEQAGRRTPTTALENRFKVYPNR